MRLWLAFWLRHISFLLDPPSAAIIVSDGGDPSDLPGPLQDLFVPEGGEFPEFKR